VECGSHAAAPAVLAITWRSQRLPRSSAHSGITFQCRYRCRPPLPVARRLACGSHAAAPAVLTIRCVAHRYPSWSRRCWMCSCRSASRSDMNAIPGRRRLCCTRFVPVHQRPRPAPAGGGEDASTKAGSLRHGEPPRGALAARPNAA